MQPSVWLSVCLDGQIRPHTVADTRRGSGRETGDKVSQDWGAGRGVSSEKDQKTENTDLCLGAHRIVRAEEAGQQVQKLLLVALHSHLGCRVVRCGLSCYRRRRDSP